MGVLVQNKVLRAKDKSPADPKSLESLVSSCHTQAWISTPQGGVGVGVYLPASPSP